MNKWIFIFGLCLFATQQSQAGTIQITGEGKSSAPPNKVTLSISVHSICYASSEAAKIANSKVTQDIIHILEFFQSDERDQITTSPGSFELSTERVPSEDGHERILCERKWKTWNTVEISIHKIEKISDLQDKITNHLASIETVNPSLQEQTFAHISSPYFKLTEDTYRQLRKQAQQAALNDAKEQFSNFDADCHFRDVHLNSVSTPVFNSVVRFEAKKSVHEDGSTPVIPENITVTAVWSFIWEFGEATACYQ